MVRRVPQGPRVFKALLEIQAPQVVQVRQDQVAPQVRLDLVRPVPLVVQVRRAQQVSAQQGKQVLLVQRVHRETLVM